MAEQVDDDSMSSLFGSKATSAFSSEPASTIFSDDSHGMGKLPVGYRSKSGNIHMFDNKASNKVVQADGPLTPPFVDTEVFPRPAPGTTWAFQKSPTVYDGSDVTRSRSGRGVGSTDTRSTGFAKRQGLGYETFVHTMASEMQKLESFMKGMDWSTQKKFKNKLSVKIDYIQKLIESEQMYFHHALTEIEVEPSAEQDLTQEDFSMLMQFKKMKDNIRLFTQKQPNNNNNNHNNNHKTDNELGRSGRLPIHRLRQRGKPKRFRT
jgi:hypothetical protein